MSTPSQRETWRGWYLDGRTPERREVVVELHAGGLRITPADGAARLWWFADVRQISGFQRGESTRLEHGHAGETLIVDDRGFTDALRDARRDSALMRHSHGRAGRLGIVLVSVTVAAGLILALYQWGVPFAATVVTAAVPVRWEEQLGEQAFALITASNRICTDPRLETAIADITRRLTSAMPDARYRMRVAVLDIGAVNAVALPGGRVIVFRGLLAMTESPEMLAGVLGHEFQHVLRRHATRAVVRQAAISAIISAVTQDARWVASALGGASVLGTLQYGREAEEEADREGLRMLQAAGIDPQGMVAFFQKMAADDDRTQEPSSVEGWRRLFATHPSTHSRVETLSALAARSPRRSSPLPRAAWSETRTLCVAS